MLFSSVSYGQLARLVTLILFGMNFHALQCHAFKPMTVSNARVRQVDTTLSAWSLPSASDFQSFTSMKSTWYDECNPTARRTVYNDPLYEELHFSSLGADWPSLVDEMDHPDESSSNATRGGTPARGNRNPLRFLASRLRRRS